MSVQLPIEPYLATVGAAIVFKVNAILDNKEKCNAWESDFIDSILMRIQSNYHLTNKQVAVVNKIFDKLPEDVRESTEMATSSYLDTPEF